MSINSTTKGASSVPATNAPPPVKIRINITAIITATDSQGREQNNAYQVVKNQIEPILLRELLAHTHNNKSHSARIAGFNISTLNNKLKQHGLVVETQVQSKGVK